jgi:hypothetical protein
MRLAGATLTPGIPGLFNDVESTSSLYDDNDDESFEIPDVPEDEVLHECNIVDHLSSIREEPSDVYRSDYDMLVDCMKIAVDVEARSDLDEEFEDTDSSDDDFIDTLLDLVMENEAVDIDDDNVDIYDCEDAKSGIEENESSDFDGVATIDGDMIENSSVNSVLHHHPVAEDPYGDNESWSEGELDEFEDEVVNTHGVDPLHSTTLLPGGFTEGPTAEATRLRLYLAGELGEEKVCDALAYLQSQECVEDTEVEMLSILEGIIGSDGLQYLDDFFQLLMFPSSDEQNE